MVNVLLEHVIWAKRKKNPLKPYWLICLRKLQQLMVWLDNSQITIFISDWDIQGICGRAEQMGFLSTCSLVMMESFSPWVPDGASVPMHLNYSRQKHKHLTHVRLVRIDLVGQTRWISLSPGLGVTLSSSFLQTLPPLVPTCGSDYQAHMDRASCS